MKVDPGDFIKLHNGDGSQPNVRLTVESVKGSRVQLKRDDFFSGKSEMMEVDENDIKSVRPPAPACND